MRITLRAILFLLCLTPYVTAFDWQSDIQVGTFTEESHPGTTGSAQDNILVEANNTVGFIRNGNWMKFAGFDFGAGPGVTNFGIDAAKGNNTNSSLEVRIDSLTGPVIGSIEITNTGDWWSYRRFNLFFSQNITGVHDLYFTCVGGTEYLFNLATFRFKTGGHSRQSDIASGDFSTESHPNDPTNIRRVSQQVQNIRAGNWVAYRNFDFGDRADYLWIEAATANSGGTISFRLGSPSGAVIGSVNIPSTGGWTSFKPIGCKLPVPISGVKDLYMTFSGGAGYLFNLADFRFQRLAPDYKPPANIVSWVKRDFLKTFSAGAFTSESHPTDQDTVRSENDTVGYIKNGSWIGFSGFNFGTGANQLRLQASSGTTGGTIEVRLGNQTTGNLIGSIDITNTGSWQNFLPFNIYFSQTVVGVQDLYFRFVNTTTTAYLFDIREFVFQNLPSGVNTTGRLIGAAQFSQESSPGGDPVVEGPSGISALPGGSWVSYENFNFGQGTNLLTVTAATSNKGGAVEFRLDSLNGPRIATLDVTHTGSWTLFREYTVALSQPITGTRNLFVRFVDTNGQTGSLMNLKEFIFENKAATPLPPSNEGTLLVYDPVTGLAPSPYYTYSVQKVSLLNAPLKQNASNWDLPFAWFSECKTGSDPYNTAYYLQEMAGWSHTYCNFELGRNTPIVVKITRNTVSGAPSGPIFMANAHPAHKVQSCEVINGDVYVTMSEPALITVDIDGQMDTRDAPRSAPAELSSSKPYASKLNGSHAVSIFANPVITDKPVIGGPGVRYIAAGDPLPAPNDPSWTTLYFGKGMHYFSRNPDGSPGIWTNGDGYVLMSNKTCYIPGDAMIYGTFDGRAEGSRKDKVRVYGYGTISGARLPHYLDPYWQLPAQAGTVLHERPITLSSGYDCSFEGITLADPANHGISFDFGARNSRKWIKQISWRANSDMGGIPGIVEDCFFRLQDDGPYVGGNDFRRNTLWFDCNGSPFRGTFMLRGAHDAGHQTVIEDCDIIYVRSNWGGEVIGAGDHWEIGTYPDGTRNTGQHLIFRNIRITDPRPTRVLFGFGVPENLDSGFAGMRFENIEYRHTHSWGNRNSINGSALGPIDHLYFRGVSINGKPLNAALLSDPSVFQTSNVSDIIFDPVVDPNTVILNFDNPQQTYLGDGTLRVSADADSKIELATGVTITVTEFAMTGGLITIDSGVTLQNGGWNKGVWTNNRANMEINGTLDLWNGNPVYVNALSGAGSLAFNYPWTAGARQLVVGVNGGGGTFSGAIAETHFSGSFIRIVKNGSGTQVFNNLANQKPKEIVINAGVIELAAPTDATWVSDISGVGSLNKAGAGVLTLSGGLSLTGPIIVSQGTLSVGTNLATTANLTIATGAKLNMNFTGQRSVSSLRIAGSSPLPSGIYNSSHPTYGSYFTGSGTLRIPNVDYDAWTATNSVTGGPNADDDKDGLTNQQEYAFGSMPNNGSSVNPIAILLDKSTGNFSYNRRQASLTGMTYSVWYSSNLTTGSWFKDTGAIEGTPVLNGAVETVPVTISPALLTNPNLFIKVRAE